MEELKIQELINDLKSQDREKIDFPEFLSLVTWRLDEEEVQNELILAFQAFDKWKSGTLNYREFITRITSPDFYTQMNCLPEIFGPPTLYLELQNWEQNFTEHCFEALLKTIKSTCLKSLEDLLSRKPSESE